VPLLAIPSENAYSAIPMPMDEPIIVSNLKAGAHAGVERSIDARQQLPTRQQSLDLGSGFGFAIRFRFSSNTASFSLAPASRAASMKR